MRSGAIWKEVGSCGNVIRASGCAQRNKDVPMPVAATTQTTTSANLCNRFMEFLTAGAGAGTARLGRGHARLNTNPHRCDGDAD